MDSLEHQDIINDLHIENTSKNLPPEYPQYDERKEQAEFAPVDERVYIPEGGLPEEKTLRSKSAVQKAMQAIKTLMTFCAMLVAAAIVLPDAIPFLDNGSPVLIYAEFNPEDESIYFSMALETRITGDELSVIVHNDFIDEEGKLFLNEFKPELHKSEDETFEGEDGEPPVTLPEEWFEPANVFEGEHISMQEEYYVSAGPEPSKHSVYGEIFGLKEHMSYNITVICGNKTLFYGSVTTGSGQAVVVSESSSSSH